MSAPNIDFTKIRAHRGSQHHGFEELCCQLASLETQPSDGTYYRKGPGADAGVECYVAHRNGTETGWQAKYFFQFESSQVTQLDASIQKALAKHPRLNRYVVCLPINLRDERKGKAQSELARWQAWVKKWKAKLKTRQRSVSIDLWGATELHERLTRNTSLYAGRVKYWFDQSVFDPVWFKQRFEVARAALGERYTPETNVDLPIRRALLAFGRDDVVQEGLEAWFNELEEVRFRAVNSLDRVLAKKLDKARAIKLDAKCGELSKSIFARSKEPQDQLPVALWYKLAKEAVSATYECTKLLWNIKAKPTDKHGENVSYASHSMQRLDEFLHKIADALSDSQWQIVNSRKLLIYGDAGVGKSHLFGDAVDHWISRNKPAILILGSSFVDGDPWRQILDELGLNTLDRDVFLGALDAAAQAANMRAVLLIDALNERKGLDVWPSRLASFLSSIEPFPRIAVAVSCRTTYLQFVVPTTITEKQLPRIEHVGFAGKAGEAARVYLDRRGIVRMAAPNLVPEFENPLFLKTCCDFLQKEGSTEFPRGLQGVSKIFEFYFSAVARQVEARLKLDPRQNIVVRAISALTDAVDTSERGYVELDVANAVLENVFPSEGQFEKSLLSQLESEGMLAVEPLRTEAGEIKQFVRFTFERYSDHRIAARLFDQHLEASEPLKSFAASTPLNAYLTGDDAYRKTGIIEAMAIQLPERTELEIPDALPPGSRTPHLIWQAFHKSVLWRDQKSFRKRTIQLLEKVSGWSGRDEVLRTLVAVASEPDNLFNAFHLHKVLSPLALAERDQHWSLFVVDEAEEADSHIQTLITWTRQNGFAAVDDDRAELAAIILAWLFSTNHRAVRDTATKALTAILAKRLPLAVKLIQRFVGVNDLYIIERVLAAAYGAALQGLHDEELGQLAKAVYQMIFATKQPVVHVLVRDYARGIIELAKARNVLPASVSISKARPPYNSPWPIENVSAQTIESYIQDHPKGPFADSIVSSSVNDGDFARYEVDSAVRHWSSLPISDAGMSQKALFERWKKKVLQDVPKSKVLLNNLISICDALCDEDRRTHTPLRVLISGFNADAEGAPAAKSLSPAEKKDAAKWKKLEKQLDAAESRLERALGKKRWAEYCDYARAYIQRDIYQLTRRYFWPPQFDSGLARRWICKRAHDLGWTAKRFAAFEHNLPYGRHEHRVERIGKKYQWIALHELIARLADNASFTDHQRALGKFSGPWQTLTRDIDPSLLADKTYGDVWKQWGPTWWMPAKASLKPISREARLLWLDNESDIINDASLIAVRGGGSDREWFVLNEYVGWPQWGMVRGERTYERLASFSINCLLVRRQERESLVKALSGRIIAGGRHDLPSLEISGAGFIGEYSWHPLYESANGWVPENDRTNIPVATQPTEAKYTAKQCEFDYSLDESFNVKLPSVGLVQGMKLRLRNGGALSYVSENGDVVFFDASTVEPGPSAALVERNAFLEFLSQQGLEAVWVISAWKEVFSGRKFGGVGWGGERSFCSIYWLTPEGFAQRDHKDRRDPTSDQLRDFLAGDDEATAPGSARKARQKSHTHRMRPALHSKASKK